MTKVKLLIWLSIIMLGSLILIGCSSSSDIPKISFGVAEEQSSTNYDDNANTKEPLKVAIAAVISAKESMIYYEDLIKYLGEELNRPIEIVQRKTYGEVNDLLRVGQVDLAFVCTYAYIIGKEEFGLELLVAPQVNGKPTYQNYIIVPKDSDAEKLEDLKGKRFAFTDPISFTGRLYPTYKLKTMGYIPEEFFNKVIFTYSHDNSIKAVAQGIVDGAAVDGLILEYLYTVDPSYYEKIKVIHKSDEFGMPPVAVPATLKPELKEELRELFVTLHLSENKAILQKLQIEQFVVVSDSNYDGIRAVLAYGEKNEE
ncbi:MAG: phosphate/phosphite/phosphonate ABC transporter substrate-binding protein [Bacillota bacterium]|nr:phosphate/phosphite/phosphonate ABC transporter substrate-binding protein [Bacillota bacterium]